VSESAEIGRAVFFLYPPSVLEEQLVQLVVQAEYEVYLLKDHRKAVRLLSGYPNAILFVNIDEKIRDTDWETYVTRLMQSKGTAGVRIGILSYNSDPDLARHYLIDLSVQCGFIQLKLGLKESARILLAVLEANEARGKRKYVRAPIPNTARTTFNVKSGRSLYRGRIRDISSAGMACLFDSEPGYKAGDTVDDMQLNLRGRHVGLSGTVVGVRMTAEGQLYVIMFSPDTELKTRQRLFDFIHDTLQSQMDARLAALP
jgi:hypothetical protein